MAPFRIDCVDNPRLDAVNGYLECNPKCSECTLIGKKDGWNDKTANRHGHIGSGTPLSMPLPGVCRDSALRQSGGGQLGVIL